MNRPLMALSKALLLVGLVAGISVAAPKDAAAQVVVGPDDAYIAVAEPVYYNGVAHYWYRDRWYYRNGRSWASYGTEPGYLHDYRFRRWPGGAYHPDYRYHGYHR